MTAIDEVIGMEGETDHPWRPLRLRLRRRLHADGRFAGDLKPTGIRPMFSDRLEQQGISLSGDVFGDALAVSIRGGGW